MLPHNTVGDLHRQLQVDNQMRHIAEHGAYHFVIAVVAMG
jgi:hypothetical protein